MNVPLSIAGGLLALGLLFTGLLWWAWHDDPAEHSRRDAEGS